jgi:ribosomal protein S18 acetylase RimI-like enzyme
LYDLKASTDYFSVIAENESGKIIGRLICMQNIADRRLWYYGDLFVIPEYRRRHIATKMFSAAVEALKDKGCETVRVYVEPENTPSLALQRKLGFSQKPFQTFNSLINDGQLMFEKELGSVYEIIPAASSDDAMFITRIFRKNVKSLHCKAITYNEWCKLLSEKASDEEHFFVCRGAMPVAWLKINGLDNGDMGWISMLAVEPCFQHKGVGAFAVKFAEDFLPPKGKKQIGVQTTEDNVPALSLYKKCGFEIAEKYSAVAEDGTDVIKVRLIKNV